MATRKRFTGKFTAKVTVEALCGDKRRSRCGTRSTRTRRVRGNSGRWGGGEEAFTKGTERNRGDHEGEIRDLHAKIGELPWRGIFLAKGVKQ